MAFTNTMKHMEKVSGGDIEFGTFTNDSTAGGDVVTRLTKVDMFIIQPINSSVNSTESSVNEIFPLLSGTVTVVTPSDSLTYQYIAFGGQ